MATATRSQNATLTGTLPVDRPTAERPHRLYVATSNHCNRACPWCCTCSSPRGRTFLALERYRESFPAKGPFAVQLEGGEPTIHRTSMRWCGSPAPCPAARASSS